MGEGWYLSTTQRSLPRQMMMIFFFIIIYFALIKKMTNKGVEYIEQPHNAHQEFITMYCTVHVLVLGCGVPPSF